MLSLGKNNCNIHMTFPQTPENQGILLLYAQWLEQLLIP